MIHDSHEVLILMMSKPQKKKKKTDTIQNKTMLDHVRKNKTAKK